MADKEHIQILQQGVDVWNEWRPRNPEVKPDLSWANLKGANLERAKLSDANLFSAVLYKANLRGANLTNANLRGASLIEADLTGAKLAGADLRWSQLIQTTLVGATLTGSYVYGASVWDIKANDRTKQQNLIITDRPHSKQVIAADNITDLEKPVIKVDSIEVAQFIYLLLDNPAIRKVIDTVTSKAVLILGRFSKKRKPILDAIRKELRKHHYLPILFDFDVPGNRDITETVSLLAHMARFIIADLTDPSSIPKELEAIVPSLAVPVQPLIQGMARPFTTFKDYWRYEWVLPPYRYATRKLLLSTLAKKVIAPAEAKVKALRERRRAIEVELTAPRTSA